MEVRRAIKNDSEDIHRLLCDIARLHAEGNPDVFEGNVAKYGISDVEKIIEDPNVYVFSAVEDGRVVGYLICMKKVTEADGLKRFRRVLYIDDLCVDGGTRGKGVGKALFDEAKKLASELKCSAIDLNVWAFNKNAIAFYEKMGMTESRRHMELKV